MLIDDLYALLMAHQQAFTRGHRYYCWRSADIYNRLKRTGRESRYYEILNQVRDDLAAEAARAA